MNRIFVSMILSLTGLFFLSCHSDDDSFCQLKQGEIVPKDGSSDVPINTIIGPCFQSCELFGPEGEIELEETKFNNSSRYFRPVHNLQANAEYIAYVDTSDNRFSTGSNEDLVPPGVPLSCSASTLIVTDNSFVIDDSECGTQGDVKVVFSGFQDSINEKTYVVNCLNEDKYGGLSAPSDNDGNLELFILRQDWQEEEPLNLVAVDGSGNTSATVRVDIKKIEYNCWTALE